MITTRRGLRLRRLSGRAWSFPKKMFEREGSIERKSWSTSRAPVFFRKMPNASLHGRSFSMCLLTFCLLAPRPYAS